jgi:tripartite-type tricarboxylate transporter receptor subunit TctC
VGTHAINPGLYRKMPYDAQKDFAPIGFAGYTPTLLVVAANSPLQSLKDLQAAAGKSGGISFASAGNGTSGHPGGRAAEGAPGRRDGARAPTRKAASRCRRDGGADQFMFYHPAAVMPQVKAGKLRALGVSSAKRTPPRPTCPRITEQGFGEFDLVAWFMLYAPAATPAPVLAKLRDAVNQAVASPRSRRSSPRRAWKCPR